MYPVIGCFKVIALTVVVYFFKVSQYRKYTQTNIRIHFINKQIGQYTHPGDTFTKLLGSYEKSDCLHPAQ